jgi:hypothetical protein
MYHVISFILDVIVILFQSTRGSARRVPFHPGIDQVHFEQAGNGLSGVDGCLVEFEGNAHHFSVSDNWFWLVLDLVKLRFIYPYADTSTVVREKENPNGV